MTNTTKTGTILIRTDTVVPGIVDVDSEPYAPGWRQVTNFDGHGLGRQIQAAGWIFFLQAGAIKSMAFGMDPQETSRRAVRRLLAKLQSDEYNSLEITQLSSKSLGGISCSSVSAHSRHIQESPFLFRTKDAQGWDRTRLTAA